MKFLEGRRYTALSYIFFLLCVIYLFQDTFFIPHKILYSITTDGIKNVFTYLYHVKYGQGTHFTGMNYPFGEHVLYTDNQPIVSMLLAWLDKYFHFSLPVLLGIFHSLMPLAFFIGMIYFHKILLDFGIRPLLATFLAGVILVMAPQAFRIPGHYALSYACFIPMLFYWSLKYHNEQSIKPLFKILFLCLIFSLLHLYYMIIALMWAVGYIVAILVVTKGSVKEKANNAGAFSASVFLAAAVIFIFIRITDPVRDRPIIPYGGSVDKPLKELFTTITSPLWQGMQQSGLLDSSDIKQDTNDPGYIPVSVVVLMIIGMCLWINAKVKKKEVPIRFKSVWLIIGIVTLLYAIGIHRLWELPLLKRILAPLRQFRSTDRLSWIFYFISSVYAVVVLQYVFTTLIKNRKNVFAYTSLILILGLWTIEANGYVISLKKRSGAWLTNYDHFFLTKIQSWQDFLKQRKLKGTDFQAILSLPFIDVGSEKLWIPEQSDLSIAYAYRAALPLHLPIMDINMSRTSWSQSFDQSTISSGWLGKKRTLEKIGNKPLLLIYHTPDKLNPDEQTLLEAATYLGNVEMLQVYSFYPKKYLQTQDSIVNRIIAIAERQQATDSMVGSNGFYFVHHGFENVNVPRLMGNGAFSPTLQPDSVLLTISVPKQDSTKLYEFSVWAKVPRGNYKSPYLTIIGKDVDNKELFKSVVLGKYSNDNSQGLWLRVYKFFEIPRECRSLDIVVHNEEDPAYISMDELLIRPVGETVISKFGGRALMANNHILLNRSDHEK